MLRTGPTRISPSLEVLTDVLAFEPVQLLILDRPDARGIILDGEPATLFEYRQNVERPVLVRREGLGLIQHLFDDGSEHLVVADLRKIFPSGYGDGLQLFGAHHGTRPVVTGGMALVAEYRGEFHEVLASGPYARNAHLPLFFAQLLFDQVRRFISALTRQMTSISQLGFPVFNGEIHRFL